MDKVQQAVASFKDGEGFSCSQSILSTFSEDLGVDRETALKIATGFGGGMGRMGEVCGAVTGAFMVIGLKHGRINLEDKTPKEQTYALMEEFVRRFKERHGSILCRELLHCDISTEVGQKEAKEQKVYSTVCPKLVKDAADILVDIL